MKLVYFAWVRQRVGKSAEVIEPPAGAATVADLVAWLKTRDDGYAAAFADTTVIRAARDHEHVDFDAPIAGASEIAFFPPVTGG